MFSLSNDGQGSYHVKEAKHQGQSHTSPGGTQPTVVDSAPRGACNVTSSNRFCQPETVVADRFAEFKVDPRLTPERIPCEFCNFPKALTTAGKFQEDNQQRFVGHALELGDTPWGFTLDRSLEFCE